MVPLRPSRPVWSRQRTGVNCLPFHHSHWGWSWSSPPPAIWKRRDKGAAWGERSKRKYMAWGPGCMGLRARRPRCSYRSAPSMAVRSQWFSPHTQSGRSPVSYCHWKLAPFTKGSTQRWSWENWFSTSVTRARIYQPRSALTSVGSRSSGT